MAGGVKGVPLLVLAVQGVRVEASGRSGHLLSREQRGRGDIFAFVVLFFVYRQLVMSWCEVCQLRFGYQEGFVLCVVCCVLENLNVGVLLAASGSSGT